MRRYHSPVDRELCARVFGHVTLVGHRLLQDLHSDVPGKSDKAVIRQRQGERYSDGKTNARKRLNGRDWGASGSGAVMDRGKYIDGLFKNQKIKKFLSYIIREQTRTGTCPTLVSC